GYRFPHCFPQDHLEGILIHGVPPLPLVPPFIHIPLHIIPYTTRGFLAGIGFTMALFIAALAFPSPSLLDQAKLGVLSASLAAALLGLSLTYLSAHKGV
ncbi:Na+/H+ antiporter NhaA, partial [Thermus sp.]|uniref:Na+/H+ antiporter NhaA n=1 Tax=Thermus sp. TaxID=275 RepID=UPI00307F4F39